MGVWWVEGYHFFPDCSLYIIKGVGSERRGHDFDSISGHHFSLIAGLLHILSSFLLFSHQLKITDAMSSKGTIVHATSLPFSKSTYI